MPAKNKLDDNPGLISRDDQFLCRLNEVIKANIGNELFGVNDLAGAMSISRVHLYRKIHRLTGKNISQYIREWRLQYARELLLKDVATVAEIAYRAGFTSPAYFSKCFHEYYGYPPGEVKKRNGQAENEIPSVEELPAIPEGRPFSRINPTLRMVMIFAGLVLISVLLILLDYFYRGKSILDGNAFETIVIMPFRNDSADPANQYFCNGMREAIQHHLIQVGGLRVFTIDVANFPDEKIEPMTAAAEMGVDFLMYGSVCKSEKEFSIGIQLVDGSNGEILWAEIYHEPLTERIFEIQQKITASVVQTLGIKLTPNEIRIIGKDPMTDPEAYDYALKAWDLILQFWKGHEKDYVKSIHFFADKALAIDPRSPFVNQIKGGAYLAEIWSKGKSYPEILRSKQTENPLVNSYDSALHYADLALQADPEYAMAYTLKGNVYQFQGDRESSLVYKLKALELMPNDPLLNMEAGRALVERRENMDYLIKGFTCLRKSFESLPKNDPNYFYRSGDFYFWLAEYPLAGKNYLESTRVNEGYSCPAWLMYFHVLTYQGKFRESAAFMDSVCAIRELECPGHCVRLKIYYAIIKDEYEKAERLLEDKYRQGFRNILEYDSLYFAHIYMNTARQEKAKEILSAMLEHTDKESATNGYLDYYEELVLIYSLLNERETALQYLDSLTSKVVLLNEWDWIMNFPYCRNIREEPRFKIFMERARKKNEEVRALVLGMDAG